jgi:hypothetical protein
MKRRNVILISGLVLVVLAAFTLDLSGCSPTTLAEFVLDTWRSAPATAIRSDCVFGGGSRTDCSGGIPLK